MRLLGRDGTELSLAVVGYQFPEARVDPWDSNSLLVAVRVVSPRGTWQVVDPCLTTWEVQHLVGWLATVAAGAPDLPPLSLTEPNVAFTARPAPGGRILVRACFQLERRPPWAGSAAGARDLCVDLDLTPGQLARAALSLRADLSRFPQRGDDPTL